MPVKYDLVIHDARVAVGSDVFSCDVGIRDGRIAALGAELPKGEDEIDARGKLLLPGGVESHLHIDQVTVDDTEMADDFESGTRSAICGGNTTVIPFAVQLKGQTLRAAVTDYHRRADGNAHADYAFHLIITDPSATALEQELPALIADGYTSFKIFMTYAGLKLEDRQILEVLSIARRERAMTMVHAENDDVIAWLTDRLSRAGRSSPKYHAIAHPQIGEGEATQRAITFSELMESPILIVHVSSREAVREIQRARSRGIPIYAETCPQYIVLTAADLDRPGFEGVKCICSPPPRDKETQEVIWQALADGTFSVFSSDHSAFRYGGNRGKFRHGQSAPFWKVPNGIPGVETRLPILFSEGVMKGRISLQRFIEVTSTNAARIYGLAPRKGSIAIGADADLVLWNTDREVRIGNDMLHHAADYTPYEGMTVSAWPDTVLLRGQVAVRDGKPTGTPKGAGQFLSCGLPEVMPKVPENSRSELSLGVFDAGGRPRKAGPVQ
jgi:dihydropyrimidinase